MQPSYVHKELESEAECQKQFRAFPVPTHVSLPLYHQMTQLRETRRKQCLVQRKDFLLSTQKPFSFQERERERREKLVEMLKTLPTYISDATRKRGVAIRKTLEMKESKKGESAEWMRSFQMRSQAMQKTVAIRAKVTDPHSSLKDVYHEQLQRHREADQQRVKEYTKELRDMKERVTQRPYLFERVKQKHAKAQVEQTYRKKLQEAGLNERFVEAAS
ncbi:unnamed protein product [Merluccius merluccius]